MFNILTPTFKGLCNAIVSLMFAGITWFTPAKIETTVKVTTAVVSIITGFFACRYYYYSTKEKQKILNDKPRYK